MLKVDKLFKLDISERSANSLFFKGIFQNLETDNTHNRYSWLLSKDPPAARVFQSPFLPNLDRRPCFQI
jgi:hypothetical protein